jgi:DnaJ-class molecular chaperone
MVFSYEVTIMSHECSRCGGNGEVNGVTCTACGGSGRHGLKRLYERNLILNLSLVLMLK